MEKQQFNIAIDAPREKVWSLLWDNETYPVWTSVFSAGSRAETDWKEGSQVLFLGAENEGMVSLIASKKPNEFMSFKHIGTVKDGVIDTDSKQTKEWAGALENYTLKTVNGKTELTVDMDITEEFKDYFQKTWPKALEKLKEIAEAN
jgi:uncharacterized protein YndB with AHSA1/START domain